MKKFAISLIALAAVSTGALASDRSYELRESPTYFGQYSEQNKLTAPSVNAFAVANDGQALSNFERLKLNQEKNEGSSH